MNELPVEFEVRLSLAKTDKIVLNKLIGDYMPFIKKCLSGVFFKTEARRDNLTEAMLAFIHSVQTYQPEAGAFIAYAQTVIRNRLINAAKKELNLKKSFFSISADANEKEMSWDAESAQRHFDYGEEQKRLQTEIGEIDTEFSRWGFDLDMLVKNSPKQKRSRSTCYHIARKLLADHELTAETLRSHKLPVQRLAALSGASEKTLEKYRRYIVAILVILRGDYPYIHSFLPQFFDEEDML